MPPRPKAKPNLTAKTAAMPRAKCPLCGREVSVRRVGGQYGEHRSDASKPALCWGSGKTPELARALMSR